MSMAFGCCEWTMASAHLRPGDAGTAHTANMQSTETLPNEAAEEALRNAPSRNAMSVLGFSLRLNPYALAGASRIGVQVVALLTMMSAVAKLEPATFGAFSMGWLLTVIGNTFLYSGLYQYLLRSRALDVDRDVVFWLLLAEGGAISIAMALAGAAARFVGDPGVAISLFTLAPLTLLGAASAWCDALLTRQQRTAAVGVICLLAEVAGALVLIAALAAGLSLWALLAWRIASSSVGLMGLASLVEKGPRWRWSRAAGRAALREGLPLQGGTLVRTLAIYAADYLLAFFLSPAASAAYRAASRVSVAGSDVFLQPLRPMTWEAMARHEREARRPEMARVYLEQLRFVAFFASPVLAGVALFSSRLFAAFAAAGWASAGPVLVLLALARIPSLFDFFLDPVLVCTGRSGLAFRLRTLQTVLVLAGVTATARFGPAAVALWQLSCSGVLALLATVLIIRILQVRPRRVLGAVLPASAVTLSCCAAGEAVYRALPFEGAWPLILSIAAMASVLLAMAGVLHRRGRLGLPRF
jgi:O-antigen/teichoic acid export membrane protein